ncbi:MAG: RagB/SusD family nutrient uptake outer membrane protein [Cyclobacteriaceae bacterium]|nr:RagB/SusD family nutrient uptake outer membrane protein [Cyclobacteriaceae bacterium HetDA_MAG_MS6]
MMKISNYKILVLAAIFFSPMFGCEDFLEENPENFVAPENLYASPEGAIAGVNGVYDVLNSLGSSRREYYLLTEVASDDAQYTRGNTTRLELSNFTHTPANSNVKAIWERNYLGVARANMVVNRVPDIDMDETLKNRVIGEARFLRAFFYFNLVRLYGPVPLVLEEWEADDDFNVLRTEIGPVYDAVIADLQFAESNLPSYTTYSSDDAGRASEGAAKALLAKVYLTRASSSVAAATDFASARDKALEVMNSGDYDLFPSYWQAFSPDLENGIESVWANQAHVGEGAFGAGAYGGFLHTDLSPDPDIFGIRGNRNFHFTTEFYNSYEAGDDRLNSFITGDYILTTGDTANTTQIWTVKYADSTNTERNNHRTNWQYIRYSDVLLMFAEAENEANGPTTAAQDALNEVRDRANLADVPNNLDQAAFRDVVYSERRHELFFEGHRWYDLVRWGLLKSRVETAKPGVTVDESRYNLFPVPQSERDANPNLTQNNY